MKLIALVSSPSGRAKAASRPDTEMARKSCRPDWRICIFVPLLEGRLKELPGAAAGCG